MESKRLNDYLKVIENNELISKVYREICEYEISGNLKSKEVNNLFSIIKRLDLKNQKILNSYPSNDKDIQEFLLLLEDLNVNLVNDDYVEYVKNSNDIKLKKFIEQIDELSLINHKCSEEDLIDIDSKFILINDVKYPYKEGIELLKESGHDELIEQVNEKYNNILNQIYESEKLKNILDYNRLCLTKHTMMAYIIEAIEKEKNDNIKNKLIKFKYNMLTIFDTLGNAFIENNSDFIDIERYQDILKFYYKDNKEYFDYYDCLYTSVIGNMLSWIISRDVNEIDKFEDILTSAYLKTYTSLISDKESLEIIYDDVKNVLDQSNDTENILMINNSLNLNQRLVLSKKINK